MTKVTIHNRTEVFSRNVVILLRTLPKSDEAIAIKRQLIRSACSIGANVIEARYSATRREFIQYLRIALRSSRETEYWLRLCLDLGLLKPETGQPIYQENSELSKILSSMILNSIDHIS